ncbi:MAG: tRNA 2-thiouridine(34) synthase MnmA [Bacteroidota bacterium]
MRKKRVLTGMSGGIDSTVTVILLQQMGYEVIGATLHLFDHPYGSGSMEKIKEIASSLNIVHTIIDKRPYFRESIVAGFIDDYLQGETPSICIRCNPVMKFPALLEAAKKMHCDYIATGHYVRVVQECNAYWLYRGKDAIKDQSYFLWRLSQNILKKWITPLGGLTKDETRSIAIKKGFSAISNNKESMGVCFLQNKNYRDFLQVHAPEALKRIGEGTIINEAGTIIGKHKGFPFYTIGQKQGLALNTGGKPAVININPKTNTLTTGPEDKLYTNSFLLKDHMLRIPLEELTNTGISVWVRGIGRNPKLPPQSVTRQGDYLKVTLNDKAWAMAPGQPVVFYKGDKVVGGGIVK